MRPDRKILFLFLAAASLIFTGCGRDRVLDESVALENGAWPSTRKVSFQAAIPDSTTPYNIYLTIRNSREYAFSNLFLFMTTTYPDGREARDTLEFTLAGADGRWLGSGAGHLKTNRFLLKEGVRFRQPGTYTFVMEQAMRTSLLQGIHDAGLAIETQTD